MREWDKEDNEFYPKRKINNRDSARIHHIIGSFYSAKMDKVVDYESLGERLLYSLLELDTSIERYYFQPVIVEIPYIDKDGLKNSWGHVPDVLVFSKDSKPHLIQVKNDPNVQVGLKDKNISKTCLRYANSRNWNYSIVYPKELPEALKSNINFLIGFTKKRRGYDDLLPAILSNINQLKICSIDGLARASHPNLSVSASPKYPNGDGIA